MAIMAEGYEHIEAESLQTHEVSRLPKEITDNPYVEMITPEVIALCDDYCERILEFDETYVCPCHTAQTNLGKIDYEYPTDTYPILFSRIIAYRCGECGEIYVPDEELQAMKELVFRITSTETETSSAFSSSVTKIRAALSFLHARYAPFSISLRK